MQEGGASMVKVNLNERSYNLKIAIILTNPVERNAMEIPIEYLRRSDRLTRLVDDLETEAVMSMRAIPAMKYDDV